MGTLIRFSDYQRNSKIPSSESHSLIPVEFGLGVGDLKECMSLIARHSRGTVQVRPVSDTSDEVVYLIRVCDAIALNKHLLETVELSDEGITHCIDLIQMLENINTSLLESIWSSYHCKSSLGH